MQCKGLPQALWYAQHTAQCPRSYMNTLGGKNPSISPLHKKIILQYKQLYEAQICGCSYNFKCGLSLYSLGQNLSSHSL